jgi:hypothetical protein
MAGTRVSTQRLVPAGERAEESHGTLRDARRRTGRTGRGLRVEDGEPLHARGVGQILDTALDVLVSRFGPCVGFAALSWLPFQIGNEVVQRSSALSIQARILWGTTNLVPEFLTAGFVCSFVGAHLLRRRASSADAFRNGILAAPGIAVIALLQVLTIFGLMCLCIVPFFLGYWLFAVVPAVYVLERRDLLGRAGREIPAIFRWSSGILISVARGVRLVLGTGSFGRWLGWAVVALLAVYWPLTGFPALFEDPSVRNFMEESLGLEGRPVSFTLAVISALFAGIGTAYLAIVKTVYYLDERVRREALDLELRLDRLAEVARQG